MLLDKLAELKALVAKAEGEMLVEMIKAVDALQADVEILRDQMGRMTAEQFAAHNGLYDIDLKRLGRLAKRIAGKNAGAIAHVRYGQVGYHKYSDWEAAYVEYLDECGTYLSVQEYCNLVGLHDIRASVRTLIEAQAQVIAVARGSKSTLGVKRKYQIADLEAALQEIGW